MEKLSTDPERDILYKLWDNNSFSILNVWSNQQVTLTESELRELKKVLNNLQFN